MHLDKCPCFVPLNTHARTQAQVCSYEIYILCFAPETVSASNEKACGQAAALVNEMATEALAVFDLPPLTQRDHLIN